MSTEKILGVTLGAVAVGGVLYVVLVNARTSSAAATAKAASPRAAAARPAIEAKHSDDALGVALVETGGRVLMSAIPYIFGGDKGATAADDRADAVMV